MKSVIRKIMLRHRLENLFSAQRSFDSFSSHKFSALIMELSDGKLLDPQLTLAGFITPSEQQKMERIKKICICLSMIIGIFTAMSFDQNVVGALITCFVFLYFSVFFFALFIKIKKTNTVRDAYFDTPLILEEVILIIESGLALFPAIEKVCAHGTNTFSKSIVRRYLKLVYQLTAGGIPIADAFSHVSAICPFPPVRSMLVHFDVSSSVGGELLHSLQALATQVHNEWKLSVEMRVKKLENMVVFPVFTAVIGMMFLTAAVPMVPILQFMDSINDATKSQETSHTNAVNGRGIHHDRVN